MVSLVSGQSSGRECQNVAILEFVWERLSESSTKYAMTRGYEHHEILDLSWTAFKWLRN